MKISIFKMNPGTTMTTNVTTTTEFADNFGVDINFGNDLVKLGLKFGTTSKRTDNTTFTVTTQTTDKALGDVLIYFGHPVITFIPSPCPNCIMFYELKDYDNGMYQITLAPLKMY